MERQTHEAGGAPNWPLVFTTVRAVGANVRVTQWDWRRGLGVGMGPSTFAWNVLERDGTPYQMEAARFPAPRRSDSRAGLSRCSWSPGPSGPGYIVRTATGGGHQVDVAELSDLPASHGRSDTRHLCTFGPSSTQAGWAAGEASAGPVGCRKMGPRWLLGPYRLRRRIWNAAVATRAVHQQRGAGPDAVSRTWERSACLRHQADRG